MERHASEAKDQGPRYLVGRHLLHLRRREAGWSASVDGLDLLRQFTSEAEAWSAGVAQAAELDKFGIG